MREWPLQAEREFWRSACAPETSVSSLWWFVTIAFGAEWYFKHTGKTRWLTRRVHKPFLEWYAGHLLAWLHRRRRGVIGHLYLLILVFRDAGKTFLITRAANLWLHLADPNLSLYIGSETHGKAKKFLHSIKAVMEGEDDNAWFAWLYGTWRDTNQTWNLEEVRHAARTMTAIQEPSFGTYGVDMGITGMHPDGIVLDDPHSLETFTAKQAFDACESYDANFPALRTDGFHTGVMTRYGGNDVGGHIIAQEGIASWSGMPNPDERPGTSYTGQLHVYSLQGRDKRKISPEHPKGEPVLPEVWSKPRMDHYEGKDPINFAAQIMNTPSVGEHMPLEMAQLDKMEVSRDDLPAIDFATIHLDTAFKDEVRVAHGDSNVIAGALHSLRDDGKVFVDRVIRDQSSRAEQFISKLVGYIMTLRARGIRLKCITDEYEIGKRGSFKTLLQVSLSMAGIRIGPDHIILFNRTTRKPERLRKAAAYWAEGYVRIIKGIENVERIKYEMVNLDKSDHDDVADALSDIWQDGVWKKPHGESRDVDSVILQPGDEVLRPGLVSMDLSTKEGRKERLRNLLEDNQLEREAYLD